jgi:hypothetical protein
MLLVVLQIGKAKDLSAPLRTFFFTSVFLRIFCQICHPVFTSLDFAKIIFFLQSKVVSLVSKPQPGGLGLCIYIP